MDDTNYVTSYLTDTAIDWVNAQNQPWFLWLAHVAPHQPFHAPPDSMRTLTAVGTNYRKYLAMIESMDYAINRLIKNIPANVLANTTIIFIGDNGTPQVPLQNYPVGHHKGTLYQGGIHVPMIVSGAGVTRQGEEEEALVHATDIYATVLEIAGATLPDNTIHNSTSFKHLLDNSAGTLRDYNYCDLEDAVDGGWTIRDSQYKLIEFDDGSQEFYDLLTDSLETDNLINTLTAGQITAKTDLEAEAATIRTGLVSCFDGIMNGDEEGTDCGGSNCPACVDCSGYDNSTSMTNIGCCEVPNGENFCNEAEYNNTRYISSNTFPDHEYCNTNNNQPSPLNYLFELDANPSVAASTTPIINPNTNRPKYYFGVALNGVVMAPAPATPFIFENLNTGEYNWDWVFEPTKNQGPGADKVSLDCASAHTGPQGYHYHGNMFEYVETVEADISIITTAPDEPMHIGWAADGFPILYRFAPDANGDLALLEPSYQLKAGTRGGDGITAPCGNYSGKYTNDYEYIQDAGDLDECNGVERDIALNTVLGTQVFPYFYVVTDSFPQISRCFSGTPDLSFDVVVQPGCDIALVNQTINITMGETAAVGNSVYDMAGIYVDSLTTIQNCDSIVITEIVVGAAMSARLYIEGAYNDNTGKMSTILSENNIMPLEQPFNTSPWNYAGMETVTNVPTNITDWVLVELCDANDADCIIERKACFIDEDGYLRDLDGTSGVYWANVTNIIDYTLIVRSRNHLDIASGNSLSFPLAETYDFTDDPSKTLGGDVVMLANGSYATKAGDINGDGYITVADLNLYIKQLDFDDMYVPADCNFNGVVNIADFNVYLPNTSLIGSSVVRY